MHQSSKKWVFAHHQRFDWNICGKTVCSTFASFHFISLGARLDTSWFYVRPTLPAQHRVEKFGVSSFSHWPLCAGCVSPFKIYALRLLFRSSLFRFSYKSEKKCAHFCLKQMSCITVYFLFAQFSMPNEFNSCCLRYYYVTAANPACSEFISKCWQKSAEYIHALTDSFMHPIRINVDSHLEDVRVPTLKWIIFFLTNFTSLNLSALRTF